MNTRNVLLGSSALISAAVLGLAAPAAAQTTNNPSATAAPSDVAVEEITVTGSRIRRTEFNSAQPVTILTTDAAELRGAVNTAQVLQTLPVGATAQQINDNFTGFVTTGGGGANTISLRGLGAQRTLALINGRRAGPAGVGGTVGPFDLNTIPSSLVDRIEILSGGASAVYGSDAVAGVVNFFTEEEDDRWKFELFGSVPQKSGGEEYRASVSKGFKFDRGHLQVAGEFYKNEGLRFKDRSYLECPVDYVSSPETRERLDLRDPATGDFKCLNTLTGIYVVGSNRYISDPTAVANGFDLNGFRRVNATVTALNGDINPNVAGVQPIYAALIPACAGQNVPANVDANCSAARLAFARANQAIQPTDSAIQGYRHARSPVERKTLFVSGGYDLTDSVQAYTELLYSNRKSEQRSIRQVGPTISAANPNNPFNVANNPAYNNGPYGPRAASSAAPIFVLPVTRDQDVDYYRGVLGLKGELPASVPYIGEWTWDLYGQYSRSEGTYGQDFFYLDRLNAVVGPQICNQALVTISANQPNATCPTNVNLFKTSTVGASILTPEEYAFLNGYETGETTYVHKYVEGTLSGDLFDLPAGPLGVAVGFHIRKESIDDLPGYNSRNSNYSGAAAAGATKGNDTVKEVFGELNIPLLRDLPFAHRAELNLSGRVSDYKSYGTSETYRINGTWNITPEVALRGSTGTNFRAPALYELYLGASTSFQAQNTDPCYQFGSDPAVTERQRANCAAQGITPNSTFGGAGSYTIFAQGGQGYLKAEKSDSWSIGVVYSPEWAALNVSLDYSEIEINDQVQRFGSVNILEECYDSPNFPNDPYCSLITRNLDASSPTFGEVLTVNDAYLNVSKQWNHSLDLNINYRHELPRDLGRLTFAGQFTWVLEWYTQLTEETDPEKNNGFTGYPDFAGNVSLVWDLNDKWTFAWATQMFGKTSDVDDAISGYGTDIITYRDQPGGGYVKRHIEFHAQHDVSVRRTFDNDLEITFGINNLFNEEPPFISTSGASRFSNLRLTSQYDVVGRRAFVNLKKAF
ncbi:TonB-dependent receptor plug domain-containing protein [Phenylobacterium sp. VNQ135]|uniref:TonB-dependent receptor plug domain-containing protein n=1 Tax=Phenylobacterium sp. VNQ135 TaxID=3400922 RepID=UPI003BFF3913